MSNMLRLQIVMNAVDKVTAPFRSIQQQSQRVAQKIQEQQKKLREFDNVAKRMEGFKKLQQQVSKASNQFDKARERVKQLRQSMQQMEHPTEEMKETFKAAQAEARKLQQRHQKLTEQQRQSSQQLRDLGINTNRLADHERELQQRLNRTTSELEQQRLAAQRLQQQQDRLNRARTSYDRTMGARNQLAGTGGGMLATGVATGFAMQRILMPGYNFDAEMSRVQALTRVDKESEYFKNLREQSLHLGGTTSFSPTQVAAGQGYLAMAGYKPEDILKAMPEMLDLAKAAGMDEQLAQVADITSNIQSGFKISSDQAKRLADTLVYTFTTSNTDLNMLGETMKYVAPTATAAGQEYESMLAMAGMLGNVGIQGSQAGTSMRMAILRLAAQPKAAEEALNELGISVEEQQKQHAQTKQALSKLNISMDAGGRMKQLPELLSDLQTKFKEMGIDGAGNVQKLAMIKDIFGVEASSAITALLEAQSELDPDKRIEAYAKRIKDSNGTAFKTAAIMADNLKGDWLNLESAWEDFNISFFDASKDWLRGVVQRITGVIQKISDWTKANPELTQRIFKLAAAVSVLAAVGGTLSLTLAAILGPFAILKFAMTTLGIRIIPMILGGFKGILAIVSVLFTPIGLIAVAIAAAAFLIYKYWQPIKAFFIGVWEGLREGLAGISDAFSPLQPIFNVIGNTIKKVIGWLKNFIKPMKATSQELENARRYGKSFGEGLALYIKMLLWPIQQVVKAVSWLGGAISKAANFFSSKWKEAGDNTESTLGRIVYFTASSMGGIRDAILNSDWANYLKDKTNEALNFFSTKWDEAGKKTDSKLGQIKLFVTSSIAGILESVKNWAIAAGFKEKFDEVVTFLSGLTETFLSVGKNIAISIWDGIKNEFSALKNDIGNFLKSTFSFGKSEVNVEATNTTEKGTVNSLPMFDNGGFIPKGGFGIVGERGPEIVSGPANITSRLKTAKFAAAAAMFASLPIAALEPSPSAKSESFQSILAITPGNNEVVDSRFTAKPKITAVPTLPGSEITMNTSITINAAAGQNANDIAKEVTRILEERERRANARVRSSMRDID